jgi:eukaryotic-like serine/threonine-protein kinase
MAALIFHPSSLAISQTNSKNNFSLDETYNNSGIKITYPSTGWEVQEPVGNSWSNSTVIVNFIKPVNNNVLNVVTERLPEEDITVDDYVDNGLSHLKNSSIISLNIVEIKNTTLAGNPAKEIVFTITNGTNNYKIMEVATIKEDNAYIITYLANEDQYLDDIKEVQNMIDSFEIEKPSNNGLWLVMIIILIGGIFVFIIVIFIILIRRLIKHISSIFKSRRK